MTYVPLNHQNHAFIIVAVLALTAISTSVLAQAPDSLSFQGVLTDTNGDAVADGNYSVVFKLYKNNLAVWTETQTVNVKNGVFNVLLGKVTDLSTLAFDQPIDLGIKLNGEASEMSPRTPLAAAAYAKALPGLYTFYRDDGLHKSYNVVGGAANNVVAAGVTGATISGGGGFVPSGAAPNSVLGDFATVGGGLSNTASGVRSTVGEGRNNTAGFEATVSGGAGNTADGFLAAIGGGLSNTASSSYATVPGGLENRAAAAYSFAAGFAAKSIHEGTFVWNDRSIIAGNDSLVSTAKNQFLIRADGGVGIGTASPTAQLHVRADDPTGNFDGQVIIDGTAETGNAGTGASLVFQGHDGTIPRVWAWIRGLKQNSIDGNSSSSLAFATRTSGGATVERARFDALGDFIPGSHDAYQLGNASFRWQGLWATDTSINASDRRLKNNIEDIEYGLSAVAQLRPVSYTWSDRPEAGVRLGLIAQEVLDVVPDVVEIPEEPEGYLGMRYVEFVPILIKAIQEQQELIDAQNLRIDSLEESVAVFTGTK